MRTTLRRAVVLSSAVCLAFFCSCERHHPGELPNHEAHGPGGGHGHPSSDGHGHGKDDHGHAKDAHATDAHKDHAHGAPNTGASPVGTPAQFFPAASPSPR